MEEVRELFYDDGTPRLTREIVGLGQDKEKSWKNTAALAAAELLPWPFGPQVAG